MPFKQQEGFLKEYGYKRSLLHWSNRKREDSDSFIDAKQKYFDNENAHTPYMNLLDPKIVRILNYDPDEGRSVPPHPIHDVADWIDNIKNTHIPMKMEIISWAIEKLNDIDEAPPPSRGRNRSAAPEPEPESEDPRAPHIGHRASNSDDPHHPRINNNGNNPRGGASRKSRRVAKKRGRQTRHRDM